MEEVKMDNIIFLDIDGVLNSDEWNEEHKEDIHEGILVDEEKVRLLGELAKKYNAKIVLHSGWRFWFDNEIKPLRKEAEILLKLMEREGISIDDFTPDLTNEEIRRTKKFSLVKADEIQKWLSAHAEIEKWVVFDDLELNNPEIAKHQIKTDSTIGLTPENIKQAEKVLSYMPCAK